MHNAVSGGAGGARSRQVDEVMNTINNSRWWCSGKSRAAVRAGEDKAGKPVERKKAKEHLEQRPTPFTTCAFYSLW